MVGTAGISDRVGWNSLIDNAMVFCLIRVPAERELNLVNLELIHMSIHRTDFNR